MKEILKIKADLFYDNITDTKHFVDIEFGLQG
jgi:hypothetical protein